MKILKISPNNTTELVETINVFDYACSLFGSTHLDIRSRYFNNYALIYDDAEKDESINKIASKLFNNTENSMRGICLLVKIYNDYSFHSCYEGIVDMDENDKKEIEEFINEA